MDDTSQDSTGAPYGFAPGCTRRVLLDHITGKWGVLTLVALAGGPLRWSELRRHTPSISEKMLAQTLKALEGDSVVKRVVHPSSPPRVEYSLTADGQQLTTLLLPLTEWVSAHAAKIETGLAPASTPT